MKRRTLGMSKDMKTMRSYLEDRSEELTIHLMKLGMYPEHSSRMHWRKEVYSFLHQVQPLKGKNKFPSAKFILDSTWAKTGDGIRLWTSGIIRSYGQSDQDIDVVYDKIQYYYEWSASELSRYGVIQPSMVYEKLDELGF